MIRNILAVFAGLLFGSIINMGIIMMGSSIVPPPAGADVTTVEGLKASMHLFGPINFLMPFLAHALGTLAGAWLAAFIAVENKFRPAIIVGAFFLIGGIMNVYMLPSPLWFTLVDLLLAYIPFALLGARLGGHKG